MLTDDPIRDFEEHEAKIQKWLNSLSRCNYCGEPIQQEDAVCINGDYYCDECLDVLRERIGDD